jgi:hypothetical protein
MRMLRGSLLRASTTTLRARLGLVVACGVSSMAPGLARAQGAAGVQVVTQAAADQKALAVRVSPSGVMAKVCASAPCTVDGGVSISVPDDARALLAGGSARVLELEGGHRAVLVELPDASRGGSYDVLLVAPLGGGASAEPTVLVRGFVGRAAGVEGEQRTKLLEVAKAGAVSKLTLAEVRQDVSLCGRPTRLSVRVLDGVTLTFSEARTESLTDAERKKATALDAARGSSGSKYRLLRASMASNADGQRVAPLTDGDLTRGWSEGREGDGAGEFVTMNAPSDVPILRLEVTLAASPTAPAPKAAPKPEAQPATKAPPKAGPTPKGAIAPTADGKPSEPPASERLTAPGSLLLATDSGLYELKLPRDAGKSASPETFVVTFPTPLRARCLAVVLGPTKGAKGDARVGLAEVAARSALDDRNEAALANELGGDQGDEAAALLRTAGDAGARATMAAFATLPPAALLRARGVIEGASCSVKASFFAERLRGVAPFDAKKPASTEPAPTGPDGLPLEASLALDQLRRCGAPGVLELEKLVAEALPHVQILAARELALVAPAAAVRAVSKALVVAATSPSAEVAAGRSLRGDLRGALSTAARSDRSTDALVTLFAADSWSKVPPLAQLDVLRSMGATLAKVPGASAAMLERATSGDFATRYLLLPSVAELARGGDERARAELSTLLTKDPDGRIRARAASVAPAAKGLEGALVGRLSDAEVRVREAALVALGRALRDGAKAPEGVGTAAVTSLGDAWTFVRVAAADLLGALPNDAESEAALGRALEDAAPSVRGAAVDALAARGSKARLGLVRAMADEEQETLDVRSRSIAYLGAVCDAESVDRLARLAQRGRSPQSDADRAVAVAAVRALSALHPAELRQLLTPLLAPEVPVDMRELAKGALAKEGSCSAGGRAPGS